MIPQATYQFKFVLVGDSSVGKSSILARFVDDEFHDNLLATIGVDFKFRRIKIDGKDVKIQIWDTAGQQTFRSLVSAYYHSSDAILIVYDLTEPTTFNSIIEYWAAQAENNNKSNACLFLIGNKSDMNSKAIGQETVNQIVKKHAISQCYQVSAKTGEHVQNAFVDICKILIGKNKGMKKSGGQGRAEGGAGQNGGNFKVNNGPANSNNNSGAQKKKCCG